MFFRNLTLYRFQDNTAADLARLADVLPEHALRPCGTLEFGTRGFVAPAAGQELTYAIGACTAFVMGFEDKLLPPAVLNDAVRKKVAQIAEDEDRRVGGRERKRIKDEILTDLLPRAFVRTSRVAGYVDPKHHWLVIDTASRKAAETVVTGLREALGSFPAVPMAPEESPRILMTDWLANSNLPAGFTLGDECELRDPVSNAGAIVRCRRQDLDADEVTEHLRNGKQVFKLGLIFEDRISFVLGEDLVIRKLRFSDDALDQLGDASDATEEFMATGTLMTLELQRLLARLDQIFKLDPDAPLHLHGQAAPVSMRDTGLQKAARTVKKLHDELAREGVSMTISTPGHELLTIGKSPPPE